MKRTIWDKRIPTLFGILLIAIGTMLTAYLAKTGVIVIGRAAPDYAPKDIRITNITDTSFTVSFITDVNALGSLSFGTDENLSTTLLDDRDQITGKTSSYKVHYITAQSLHPKTKYYFVINANQSVFQSDGKPFEVVTGEAITDLPPDQKPLAGTIVFPNEESSKEAVVYLTSKKAQTISALVKNGNYIIPLNSIRNQQLSSYIKFDDNDVINMLVVGSSSKSSINLSLRQINPVPPITLSNNYDFALTATPVASESTQFIGFPSFSVNFMLTKEPQITTPKEDEGFVDSQPLIKGTASPKAKVKIIIHSPEKIEAEVLTDKNGSWSYRPTKPLSAGQHTISIVARNSNGILKTITKPFVVYAAGTQLENATPSASPIPSITITPTSLPTPTLIASAYPTAIISVTNTPAPTITPMLTATPTLSPTQTPIIQLPPPGSSVTQIAGIAAISLALVGALLFFLTKGGISSL